MKPKPRTFGLPEDPEHGPLLGWGNKPGRSWYCPAQRCKQKFFGQDEAEEANGR